MCLGVIGRVTAIDGNACVADVLGVTRKVSIELLDKVKTGDYIMIHAGCAIEIVDEEEALKTIEIFKELQESAYE